MNFFYVQKSRFFQCSSQIALREKLKISEFSSFVYQSLAKTIRGHLGNRRVSFFGRSNVSQRQPNVCSVLRGESIKVVKIIELNPVYHNLGHGASWNETPKNINFLHFPLLDFPSSFIADSRIIIIPTSSDTGLEGFDRTSKVRCAEG